MKKVPGSFKDRSNQVFVDSSGIFRTIDCNMNKAFPDVFDLNIIQEMVNSGMLVPSKLISQERSGSENLVKIEHQKIPFISYPYEWSNAFLYAAAIKTIEINSYLITKDYHLIDANAFNIQFIDGNPILIDIGSVSSYDEKKGWQALNEFLEAFFYPLYFCKTTGLRFNDVYKSFLRGVPVSFLYSVKRFRDFLSIGFILNVFLNELLLRKILRNNKKNQKPIHKKRVITPKSFTSLLNFQKNLIQKVYKKINRKNSYWQTYSDDMHNYAESDFNLKVKIIKEFSKKYKPNMLLDIGCNEGFFSILSLENGAKSIISIDNDENCIERLSEKVIKEKLPILPLIINVTNESPMQGWLGTERDSFSKRAEKCDGVICLAVIHHMVIGSNIPLEQAIRWIVGNKSYGVIEFVSKDDSQIMELLAHREDIFNDYSYDQFIEILSSISTIKKIIHSENGKRSYAIFER